MILNYFICLMVYNILLNVYDVKMIRIVLGLK